MKKSPSRSFKLGNQLAFQNLAAEPGNNLTPRRAAAHSLATPLEIKKELKLNLKTMASPPSGQLAAEIAKSKQENDEFVD